ncbi:hypothetical protein D3C72_964180 [compost metagenome]
MPGSLLASGECGRGSKKRVADGRVAVHEVLGLGIEDDIAQRCQHVARDVGARGRDQLLVEARFGAERGELGPQPVEALGQEGPACLLPSADDPDEANGGLAGIADLGQLERASQAILVERHSSQHPAALAPGLCGRDAGVAGRDKALHVDAAALKR